MVIRVKIKKDDFGMPYIFTIEDVDLSDTNGCTSKLYVWKGDTLLVDGGTCTAALVVNDTQVTYIVASGDFDTVGVWDAEIEFTKTPEETITYKESTETFEWEVLETSAPTPPVEE